MSSKKKSRRQKRKRQEKGATVESEIPLEFVSISEEDPTTYPCDSCGKIVKRLAGIIEIITVDEETGENKKTRICFGCVESKKIITIPREY